MKKVEILYRDPAMVDIASGMTCDELVRKYPVSMYYARKWSGEVYRNADLDHLVRDRYKWLVLGAVNDIVNLISESMTDREAAALDDDSWDVWSDIIRRRLYDLAKDITKKN